MWALLACGACASPPPATPPSPAPVAEPQPEQPLSPKQIAQRAADSVVRLEGDGSLGTGFVVSDQGWIATNLHVIAHADALVATFRDGRNFEVIEVVAFDPDHDIALLRIEAKDLPALPLGEAVSVGDRVVAIGHPLGLSDTVSDGLISAVRRVTPTLEVLQISAPIAPGSSGGPLLNERGEVIGIATAVLREGQNLNFGVPVAYLRSMMDKPQAMSFEAFRQAIRPTRMPDVPRDVPKHELSLLNGCGATELRGLGVRISEAIAIGAPLYNAGNFRGCYHQYLGASIDMESELSPTCTGPRRALDTARSRGRKSRDPTVQAWAMRDGFDGLLDVLERKLTQ